MTTKRKLKTLSDEMLLDQHFKTYLRTLKDDSNKSDETLLDKIEDEIKVRGLEEREEDGAEKAREGMRVPEEL